MVYSSRYLLAGLSDCDVNNLMSLYVTRCSAVIIHAILRCHKYKSPHYFQQLPFLSSKWKQITSFVFSTCTLEVPF